MGGITLVGEGEVVLCKHPYTKKKEYALIKKIMGNLFIVFGKDCSPNKYPVDNLILSSIINTVGFYKDSPEYWNEVIGF